MHRRDLLKRAAHLGWASVVGCGTERSFTGLVDSVGVDAATAACDEAAAQDWTFLGQLPFADPVDVPLERATGAGWDGRLYADLSRLAADALTTPNPRFYIRTLYPDTLSPGAGWNLVLGGLVEKEASVEPLALAAEASDQGVVLLECAGNHLGGAFGLMSAARFRGVTVSQLLKRVRPLAGAARILVTGYDVHLTASAAGHSTPGASWSFTADDLASAGAFIATEMNGEPLPLDHGFPMRLVVPGWYGCACIKWVERLDWERADANATSQMIEFAARTHQDGEPELARDYRAARIQQAAMPVRLERFMDGAGEFIRIVGIAWGGSSPVTRLELSTDGGTRFEPVELCPPATQNRTWTLWSHIWEPQTSGTYALACRAPGVEMQRLDDRRYVRTVDIDVG